MLKRIRVSRVYFFWRRINCFKFADRRVDIVVLIAKPNRAVYNILYYLLVVRLCVSLGRTRILPGKVY